MFNKRTILIFLLVIGFSMSTVWAGPFKAAANTKRIPEGTKFQLEFLQDVDTYAGGIGDSFSAMLKNEQTSGSGVILPAGSIIRGSIGDLKTSKRLSRGAKLYLDFDHVVTPSGRQIPLDMAVCKFDKIYFDGGLYKNLGYGEAVKENYDKAVDITVKSVNYGLDIGEDRYGLQYLTTPICAIGGFIGSVGYFIGDSIADIFRKGKEVKISTGDVIEVQLLNPIDVPVY